MTAHLLCKLGALSQPEGLHNLPRCVRGGLRLGLVPVYPISYRYLGHF